MELYDYTYDDLIEAFLELPAIFYVFVISLIAFFIITHWKLFEKAGKPGWAAIIPIYHTVVKLEIGKKPVWWIVIFIIGNFVSLVGVASIVFSIMLAHGISKNFGKDSGFTVGLVFLPFIFYPILAFGDAKYMDEEMATLNTGSLDEGEIKL